SSPRPRANNPSVTVQIALLPSQTFINPTKHVKTTKKVSYSPTPVNNQITASAHALYEASIIC
ncbi:MAG: hypothetical protein ACYS29_07295, partial [Planctomycetota bacterium]